MDELKQNTGAKNFVGIEKSDKLNRFYLRIIALTYPIVGVFAILPIGWATDQTLQPTDLSLNQAKGMSFDANFLHGQKVDLAAFEHGNPTTAGDHRVSIFVNDKPRGRFLISFLPYSDKPQGYAYPCFTLATLQQLGIEVESVARDNSVVNSCRALDQWIPQGRSHYESSDFILQLTVAQKYFRPQKPGEIRPERWEQGSNIAFIDYNVDGYSQRVSSLNKSGTTQQKTLSFGSLLGINLEGWRLRYRQISRKVQNASWRYHGQSAYAEHDITPLRSQFRVGDTWSSGEVFDSVTFRGAQLRSDHRMLSSTLRSYTPHFSGIAETNANVTLWQQGRLVQQTSVPAGPFDIDSPSVGGYGGDYTMVIDEADGRKRVFIIPNSAPPLILNKSVIKYEVDIGKIDQTAILRSPYFIQANLFYGLTENYTLYTGTQVANGYQGIALGNALNTFLGGIAITGNISQEKSTKQKFKSKGGRVNLSYSKYLLDTQTSINASVDRVVSGNYRTLNQSSYEQGGLGYGIYPAVKQRVSLSIGQPITESFSVNLSASTYHYKKRATSYQYSLSMNKQFTSYSLGAVLSRSQSYSGVNDNTLMLSLNIPFGRGSERKPIFDSLYSTYSHDNDGTNTLQHNINGHYGEENALVYGLGLNSEKVKQGKINNGVQANIAYNSSQGQYSTSFSRNRSHQQYSLSANGSVVAHSAGVIAGRQLGNNPFAIIYAEGAQGAKISNGHGATINRGGYGILPSLTPYQENRVAVNPEGLPLTVTLEENEATVIPRMGAAVKVKMKTQTGKPYLLKVRDRQQKLFAMMSQLFTERSPHLALVSQAGRAFVQGWDPEREALFIRDSVTNETCQISVDQDLIEQAKKISDEIIYKEVSCQ
ncbi:outer membrane usher protein [Rosenbergiella nectarea]|uniref:Outer membrane usher protein n=1 Tax=Rosenbergiella nectarea TaxID=988801 RepID=A0A1H9IQH0_9GAMM|nr:fimbria/pilus outer membrane usher protein [Rosenbergiella nectarea]SEQ76863.1 outer membrane usher protein [Rosenbergiella nectarea]